MKLKKHYFEDIQLFRTRASFIWTILLLLLLVLFPFLLKTNTLSILNLMCLNIIVALGLNLLVGNTGQISLGHAGFVAIVVGDRNRRALSTLSFGLRTEEDIVDNDLFFDSFEKAIEHLRRKE